MSNRDEELTHSPWSRGEWPVPGWDADWSCGEGTADDDGPYIRLGRWLEAELDNWYLSVTFRPVDGRAVPSEVSYINDCWCDPADEGRVSAANRALRIREAREALQELLEWAPDAFPCFDLHDRPGRRGSPDAKYLRWAELRVEAAERAARGELFGSEIEWMAQQSGYSPSSCKQYAYVARERGLLSDVADGPPRLTSYALELRARQLRVRED